LIFLVPTLRGGMPVWTLRGGKLADDPVPDAPRPGRHSAAKRGNEKKVPTGPAIKASASLRRNNSEAKTVVLLP